MAGKDVSEELGLRACAFAKRVVSRFDEAMPEVPHVGVLYTLISDGKQDRSLKFPVICNGQDAVARRDWLQITAIQSYQDATEDERVMLDSGVIITLWVTKENCEQLLKIVNEKKG